MKDQPDATSPERTRTDTSPAGNGPLPAGIDGGEAWPRGHVLLDDFAVMHLLGRGGMGEVYLVQSLLTEARYAVKRARVRGTDHRRKFLRELQTWIDLPSHPNVMQLRFARTVSEEMLLFTDYAEGGSLADWIQQRRLTELPEVLRLAVQLAHGVEAAHSANIVHQDIKPANFLITRAGEAKLSDFGLAYARVAVSAQGAIGLARHAGLTPAYCSPEQDARRPLGPQTDVWSLGLSILEMFTGKVTWSRGVEAPDALETFLRSGGQRPSLAPMPDGLAGILRRCFARQLTDRWPSGVEVRVALSHLYEELFGEPLPLPVLSPGVLSPGLPDEMPRPEMPLRPEVHLARAMELAKRRASEALPTEPGTSLSPRAQMIANLSIYEEAQAILEALPAEDDPTVQRAAAELFQEKGWAHLQANDPPGASAAMARAIARWEALLQQQRDPDIASEWLRACVHQGQFLNRLDRSDLARQHVERVVRTIGPVIRAEGWDHLTLHLPDLLMTDFSARYRERDLGGALAACDRAVKVVNDINDLIRDKLAAASPGELELEGIEDYPAHFRSLGEVLQLNRACVLDDLGRHPEADATLATVVEARERRLAIEGETPKAVHDLAIAFCNRAMVLRKLHDQEGALRMLDRAAGLYDRLVEGTWPAGVSWNVANGLTAVRNERCTVAGSRGSILADLARFDEALAQLARAVAWLEELVIKEGRLELGLDLSRAYQCHAEILASAGMHKESRALFEKSEAMLQRLSVQHPGRVAEEAAMLSRARATRLGKQAGADADLDRERAIWIYEGLLKEGGRVELRPELAHLYLEKARDAAQRGDANAAEPAVDQILRLLKEQDPKALSRDAVIDWSEALQRKANLHGRRDELEDALPYYDQAIALLRPLCKGHRERWRNLASVHVNLGTTLGKLQRIPESARSYRRAVSLLEHVYRDGDVELLTFFIYSCLRAGFACFAMEQEQLGRALAERGVAAADEAVAQGRIALPEFLEQDLALARRKLREVRLNDRYAGGIDPRDFMARGLPGGSMNRAVQDFLICFSWEDKKQAVLRHEDELLDPMILTMFAFIMDGFEDDPKGQEHMRETISVHLDLLERCRQEGIEAAFADRTGEARLRALGMLPSDEGVATRSMGDLCPCGSQKFFVDCHGASDDDGM